MGAIVHFFSGLPPSGRLFEWAFCELQGPLVRFGFVCYWAGYGLTLCVEQVVCRVDVLSRGGDCAYPHVRRRGWGKGGFCSRV